MKEIVIIDYGIGNIRSVMRGIEICGYNPKLTSDPKVIKNASKVILPGVGAFENGMKGLRNKELIRPIKEFILSGKYFLGICLGMQLMMTKSYELGNFNGLDIIEGEVLPFQKNDITNNFKMPHIGWNQIKKQTYSDWNLSILGGLKEKSDVYFVHSYYVKPKHEKNSIAICNYANSDFCAVIKDENIYGCQFHPEKSGNAGLKILKNFCKKK